MTRTILEGMFTPAVNIMGRLWYWQKFAILTILFTIPVGFALFSYITQIDKSIASTEKEISGVQYVSPVLLLLQHMQQYRGMANLHRRTGDQSFQALLDKKELEIQEDITRVDAEDQKFGTAFQLSDRWETVKRKWLALQAAHKGLMPEESFIRHTELISDIIALIHEVGDKSNLILDPELSSYETMNAIINILPALTENMGQARGFGSGVKDPKKISDEERKAFINYAKIANIENAKLQDDMRDAFENDPSLRVPLEGPLQEADSAVKSFTSVMDDIVNSKEIPLSLPEYYAFMTGIINTNFSFSLRLGSVLEGLFGNRIAMLDRELKTSISITAVSYLLILYFFAGFYFLVARTVRELEHITKQLTEGKATEVPVLSNDELGEVGKSFNAIGRALIASNDKNLERTRELQKQSDELERFNKLMVGRELKMVELKQEIEKLKKSSKVPLV